MGFLIYYFCISQKALKNIIGIDLAKTNDSLFGIIVKK